MGSETVPVIASSTDAPRGSARQEVGLGWLLPTKLAAPPPRPQLVPRQRLLARLDDGLRQPLTVLAAPAGFGKTTLLAEWRATPAGAALPLAWVSLDEGDNDPIRFWSYVHAGLGMSRADTDGTALATLRSPGATPEVIAAAIVRDLAGLQEDLALVLDD